MPTMSVKEVWFADDRIFIETYNGEKLSQSLNGIHDWQVPQRFNAPRLDFRR